MLRTGGASALDVDNYSPEEQCQTIRHRSETDTPVKNGDRGEQFVALTGPVCHLLDDWLRNHRPDATDDHGRRPLLSSGVRSVSEVDAS